MKWLYRNTSLFSLLTLPLFLVDAHAQRLTEELTEGWRFMRGSFHEAAREDFNDDSWPYVRIPHDYAIDGPFDRNNDLQDVRNIQNGETSINRKTGRTGGLPYHGEAWYRRTIHINGHHRAFLYFAGEKHTEVEHHLEQQVLWRSVLFDVIFKAREKRRFILSRVIINLFHIGTIKFENTKTDVKIFII